MWGSATATAVHLHMRVQSSGVGHPQATLSVSGVVICRDITPAVLPGAPCDPRSWYRNCGAPSIAGAVTATVLDLHMRVQGSGSGHPQATLSVSGVVICRDIAPAVLPGAPGDSRPWYRNCGAPSIAGAVTATVLDLHMKVQGSGSGHPQATLSV